jgi:uncharacterized protein YuzE
VETLRLLEGRASGHADLDWDYDSEADVLYLSIGLPRPALGLDVGDGMIVRYDEATQEVLGLTLVGLRARLAEELHGTRTD